MAAARIFFRTTSQQRQVRFCFLHLLFFSELLWKYQPTARSHVGFFIRFSKKNGWKIPSVGNGITLFLLQLFLLLLDSSVLGCLIQVLAPTWGIPPSHALDTLHRATKRSLALVPDLSVSEVSRDGPVNKSTAGRKHAVSSGIFKRVSYIPTLKNPPPKTPTGRNGLTRSNRSRFVETPKKTRDTKHASLGRTLIGCRKRRLAR